LIPCHRCLPSIARVTFVPLTRGARSTRRTPSRRTRYTGSSAGNLLRRRALNSLPLLAKASLSHVFASRPRRTSLPSEAMAFTHLPTLRECELSLLRRIERNSLRYIPYMYSVIRMSFRMRETRFRLLPVLSFPSPAQPSPPGSRRSGLCIYTDGDTSCSWPSFLML
jgi:hypothetical protein